MQYRDKIIIQKIIYEINVGMQLLGDITQEDFSQLKVRLENIM